MTAAPAPSTRKPNHSVADFFRNLVGKKPGRVRASTATGSGADAAEIIGLILCAGGIVGGGTASIEGLWNAASWMMVPLEMQWTLPLSVDVFLVGMAILGMVFRARGAGYGWGTFLIGVATLALVTFSAWTNWHYTASIAPAGTDAALYGPPIKAAQPYLLLLGIELAAVVVKRRADRNRQREAPIMLEQSAPLKHAEVAVAPWIAKSVPRQEEARAQSAGRGAAIEWLRTAVRDERRLPTGREIGERMGKSARSGQRLLTDLRENDPEFDAAVVALGV